MKSLDEAFAAYNAALTEITREEGRKRTCERSIALLEGGTRIAQSVAQEVQDEAHGSLAKIVTKCLDLFDRPYTFHINFVKKRGKTEAQLVFKRDGVELSPINSSGGGVIDVAAFALRLAAILLQAHSRKLLILDEPFRFVPVHLRSKVQTLVEWVAKELDCQIIMVTHEEALRSGKVIEL